MQWDRNYAAVGNSKNSKLNSGEKHSKKILFSFGYKMKAFKWLRKIKFPINKYKL